jgi:hypothetical protein
MNRYTTRSGPDLRVAVIEEMSEDVNVEVTIIIVDEKFPVDVRIVDNLLHTRQESVVDLMK